MGEFPDSMKADSLAYFATTAPQELMHGVPSKGFPLLCPWSLTVIVMKGYECMDWLSTADSIHPEKYTLFAPFAGLMPFGSNGASEWIDCCSSSKKKAAPCCEGKETETATSTTDPGRDLR